MLDTKRPIDDLEEFEEYISEFVGRRKLKMTDTRQWKMTEDHSNRLNKELGKQKNLLRYRINDADVSKSFACDSQFVNNTHFFYGDGSRLGHNHREKHYALDFPMNTRLNKTDFTRHLQKLAVSYTNVTNEWLTSTKNILKPGTRIRSRSAPNIRLKTDKAYDRLDKGLEKWLENYFYLHNVDESYGLPKDLGVYSELFTRSLTRTMTALTENLDPIALKPGWQSVSSILFSTFDNHFYALIEPSPKALQKFSDDWDHALQRWRPKQTREEWNRKNVILHLKEFKSEGTMFRRARHICTRNNEDWFIELDTGKLRMIKNAGIRDVMRLPLDQSFQPSAIVECRFKNTDMTLEDVTREINKIRADGKMYIVGFDKISRKPWFDLCRNTYQKLRSPKNRSTIKTAIIEPVVSSQQKPLMTTIFCGNLNCTGCYSWRAFKKPIEIKESVQPEFVFIDDDGFNEW